MTKSNRIGHWRTNKHGTTTWVQNIQLKKQFIQFQKMVQKNMLMVKSF